MNSRYQQTFARLKKKNQTAFCPFGVLGHPTLENSFRRIGQYLKEGADMLELGIPFSDPVADGPVIQLADEAALKNGTRVRDCLELIGRIRSLTDIPIGILTYANIVYQYGIEKFYRDLQAAGADSILIADVPLEEILPFSKAGKKYGLDQIMMVSENTSLQRLALLEKVGSGFFYVVSTMGVTGERKKLGDTLGNFLRALQKNTKLPLMVGFGVSTAAHIRELRSMNVQGIIIGSALVKKSENQEQLLHHFHQAFHEQLND